MNEKKKKNSVLKSTKCLKGKNPNTRRNLLALALSIVFVLTSFLLMPANKVKAASSNFTPGIYLVSYNGTNFRSAPSLSSSILHQVNKNEQLSITETSKDTSGKVFGKGIHAGVTGWVRIDSGYATRIADLAKPNESSPTATPTPRQQSYTYYYQKDPAWAFGGDGEYACYITSYAMVLKNLGIYATPRDVYNVNGGVYCYHDTICKAYNVTRNRVYVTNTKSNIINALLTHPEGIMVRVSTKYGYNSHTIVARNCINGVVYFDDPYTNKPALPIEQTFAGNWSNVIYYETLTKK